MAQTQYFGLTSRLYSTMGRKVASRVRTPIHRSSCRLGGYQKAKRLDEMDYGRHVILHGERCSMGLPVVRRRLHLHDTGSR